MKTLLFSILVAGAIAMQTACSNQVDPPEPKTFVLVHGVWQAPYAWQSVKDQLIAKGRKVVVIELPGHGADNTAPATLSMDTYRDKVITAINGITGTVILVGHSMGGMVVTATAEKIPNRIDKLVYIGAFVPANGQSLLALAGTDSTALLGPAIVPSADQLTLGLKPDRIVPVFIQDGPDAVKKLVTDNYRPEPAIPFTNPVATTPANFGSVNKYYVYTTQDNAIGLPLQKRMVAAAGIKNTYSLASSHCPFLSMPDQVTNVLLSIAN